VKTVDVAEEVAAIEAALRTLLSAIDGQHDKRRGPDQQIDGLRTRSGAQRGPLFRPADSTSPVEDLLKDPLGQSYRLGIRRLGKRLNELDGGGSQLMSEAIDRVCKNHPDWAETVDQWWNGIGDWVA
jgi:hypothetical protein